MKTWEKFNCLIFRNCGTSSTPSWLLVDKSTLWEITFNAETEDQDYIIDEMPTTNLKRYKPSMAQELATVQETGKLYDTMAERLRKRPTGEDAKAEYLISLPFEDATNKQYAWKVTATEVFDGLSMVDKKIKWNINIGGTIANGTIAVADGTPTFTAEV